MSRVAIVGVEGSGKTVLMAALGDMFGKPSDGSVYLMPENQSAFSFMTQIPHKMREEHQWPAATAIASMKHLKWTIRVGQKVLMDLEMLDYPGELYRMAFGERKKEEIEPYIEQVHEFLEHLVTADYLVVLLNLKDALNIGGNARNNETVWLTRGIFDYSQKLPNIQKRLLLFTQADRYPDELAGPGGLMAAKEKFMPMLHVLYPDLECAAVSVATDESDAPARTFSASHGVTGLMRWLALQTEEGTKVQAQLEKFSEWIENARTANASNCHVEPKEIKAQLETLDSINPGLCEIMEPCGLEHRRSQLRTLYLQSVLASCDACREKAKRTSSLVAFKQVVGEYHQHLESLSEQSAALSDNKELEAIQGHREDYEHFLSLFNLVDNFIKSHSSWQLSLARSWLPLSNKYTDLTSKNLIAQTRSFYAAAKYRHIAIGFGAVFLLIVFAAAVNISNKARQERAAADAKARQERALLEQKATQGDTSAQWRLGNIFDQEADLHGYSEWEIAREKRLIAKNWWRKSAMAGYISAQLKMASISDNNADKCKWYEMAANQGNYEAQMALGEIKETWNDKFKWYEMAALSGKADAQYMAGYWHDQYYERNKESSYYTDEKAKAVEWYQKAAAQGHTLAQQALDRLGYTW